MRFLIVVAGILIGIVLAIYITLFTTPGNSFLRGFVEAKINKELSLDGELKEFRLDMSSFAILYSVDKNNIKLDGSYSLFSKNFVSSYRLDLVDLRTFSTLADTPLRGAIDIIGSARGDSKNIDANGILNIASTKLDYSVKFLDLKILSFAAKANALKLEDVLDMFCKNPYAKALVDLDVNIKNATKERLDANMKIATKDAMLNSKYMQEDFNVTIPDTPFSLNLDTKLKNSNTIYSFDLDSKLLHIKSDGTIVPEPLSIDSKYTLDIVNLEALKPITKQNLKGPLYVDGFLKGNKDDLRVEGMSDLASSKTTFKASLKDFSLKNLELDMSNLDIAKLLSMLDKPSYATGRVALDIKMRGFDDNIDGDIVGVAQNVKLNQQVISKELSLDIPQTNLEARAVVMLKDSIARSNSIKIDSNLAKLSMKDFSYDIKNSLLKSGYELDVGDLNNLRFFTKRELRGSFLAKGEIKKDKDLEISVSSNSIGKLKANLKNSDLIANVTDLKASKLLQTLLYPEVLESDIEAKLKYNFLSSSGVVDMQLKDAIFNQNQVFDMLKKFAKIDVYKESLNGVSNIKIEKQNYLATLDLSSKNISIKSPKTLLYGDKNIIDSDIVLANKHDTLNANIKGDINKPTVNVDLDAFLKSDGGQKAIQKVDKLLDKLFKKHN